MKPPSTALDVLIHAYADTGDKHYLKLAKQLKELVSRKQGQAVKPVINRVRASSSLLISFDYF